MRVVGDELQEWVVFQNKSPHTHTHKLKPECCLQTRAADHTHRCSSQLCTPMMALLIAPVSPPLLRYLAPRRASSPAGRRSRAGSLGTSDVVLQVIRTHCIHVVATLVEDPNKYNRNQLNNHCLIFEVLQVWVSVETSYRDPTVGELEHQIQSTYRRFFEGLQLASC